MSAKVNLKNIRAYITGNYRFMIYYSKNFYYLMRKHIREQIDWRMIVMRKECFNTGSCEECGCEVPALQMANKTCDGMCYPEMMDKKTWEEFKGTLVYYERSTDTTWVKDKDNRDLRHYKTKDYVERTRKKSRRPQRR